MQGRDSALQTADFLRQLKLSAGLCILLLRTSADFLLQFAQWEPWFGFQLSAGSQVLRVVPVSVSYLHTTASHLSSGEDTKCTASSSVNQSLVLD